jgi:hypothetical protein
MSLGPGYLTAPNLVPLSVFHKYMIANMLYKRHDDIEKQGDPLRDSILETR